MYQFYRVFKNFKILNFVFMILNKGINMMSYNVNMNSKCLMVDPKQAGEGVNPKQAGEGGLAPP